MGNAGTYEEFTKLANELIEIGRDATHDEIQLIRHHVARAGFDPDALERVRGRGAGIRWRGRTLRGRDMLPPAEVHYIRHVLSRPEWPRGTTYEQFLASVRKTVLDDDSGVFLSQYQERWQVGFLGESRELRGPLGKEQILIDFRLQLDHILTAHQISLEDLLAQQHRTGFRWLRTPTAFT
jgi:hypothetical protein